MIEETELELFCKEYKIEIQDGFIKYNDCKINVNDPNVRDIISLIAHKITQRNFEKADRIYKMLSDDCGFD